MLQKRKMDLPVNKEEVSLHSIYDSIRAYLEPFSDILDGQEPFAVAVSGGSDSMALVHAILKFYPHTRISMRAVTFDHQLRPDSSSEANQVKLWMNDLEVSHKVLCWDGEKPTSDIMRRARSARYQAIESWMKKNDLKYLFLAHHLDDVLETLFMRLLKKTGAEGLDALWKRRVFGGVTLLRPFLAVKKDALKSFLSQKEVSWIEDPSNQNTKFARPLVRLILENQKLKNFLNKYYPSFVCFASLSRRLRETLVQKSIVYHRYGYVSLDGVILDKLPSHIVLDLVRYLIQKFRQLEYPPKRIQIETLLKAMEKGATLKGCYLRRLKGKIILMREWQKSEEFSLPLATKGEIVWDQRFKIKFSESTKPYTLKALGLNGWKRVVAKTNGTLDLEIPFPVILTLPSLWNGDMLVEVPHLYDKISFSNKNRIIVEVQSIDS